MIEFLVFACNPSPVYFNMYLIGLFGFFLLRGGGLFCFVLPEHITRYVRGPQKRAEKCLVSTDLHVKS